MALVTVNLLDTFDQWRLKTNDLGVKQGDLTTLTTTNKSNIVAAINEVVSGDSDDMENVVDDTTPQLGGNLDLNSKDITGTGNINITGTLIATSFTGNILGSGSIAGTITGTTQSPSNNSTKLATTAYVDAQVATENTIAEMDDTTLASLAQGDFLVYNATTSVWENVNAPEGVTQTAGDNSTKLATTAFVQAAATGAAGGVNTDVVTDTSPQLGGNLDLNNKDITGTGNINITGSITATSIAGTVTGVTQAAGDNSTKLATTAYANDAATTASASVSSSGLVFAVALG